MITKAPVNRASFARSATRYVPRKAAYQRQMPVIDKSCVKNATTRCSNDREAFNGFQARWWTGSESLQPLAG